MRARRLVRPFPGKADAPAADLVEKPVHAMRTVEADRLRRDQLSEVLRVPHTPPDALWQTVWMKRHIDLDVRDRIPCDTSEDGFGWFAVGKDRPIFE